MLYGREEKAKSNLSDIEMRHAILILNIQRYLIFSIFVFKQNKILISIVDNARNTQFILNKVIHTFVIATSQKDNAC